jgi:NAD(P)-dependent dehydrogenase (short-subunit alcohol dehydrogenase family)
LTSPTGQVALITGGSSGIGRETAQALAALGASVFLVSEGPEDWLREAAEACRVASKGAPAEWRMVDLAVAGNAEAAVAACVQTLGRIDILVNNAGVRRRKPFGEFTHQDFEDVVAVNLRAPFFACQAALPAMKAQGKGRIVNVGSQLGSVATAEHALYGMSKAALIYLTKAIALECAASRVTVNCVSPGATETAYMTARLAAHPTTRHAMLGHIPLGRFTRPAEVAEAIVFLATCEGDAIQGHDLLVDGGWVTH